MCSCFVFFFKQKTAYELRISDWSSDVCSSDLHAGLLHSSRDTGTLPPIQLRGPFCGPRPRQLRRNNKSIRAFRHNYDRALKEKRRRAPIPHRETPAPSPLSDLQQTGSGCCCLLLRSEEHTSELQSLMRISYAVYCLITKKQTDDKNVGYHDMR